MSRFMLLLAAFCLLVSGTDMHAAPAAPMSFELVQPGGHRFMATTRGDEYGSWTETSEGHTILRSNSTWFYAEPDGKEGIRPSNIAVGQLSQSELDAWPRGLQPKIHPGAFEVRNPRRALGGSSGLDGPLGVTRTQRVLVVLVDYNDVTFTHSDASFQALIFGATDSVKEYFLENSYGDFEIVPASESYDIANDGIIHVSRAIDHPDAGQDFGVNTAEAKAIMPLTDSLVNYALFDDNADGDITADELSIVMILAGYERSFGGNANASSPSVWGHQSKFANFFPPVPGVLFTLDGKNLAPYTMFGEQHGTTSFPAMDHQATIGIMCHELGHLIFDLPDLYDSDNSSEGIGYWGLMGSGSWNFVGSYSGDSPAHLNAWSKTVLGFMTPIDQNTPENGVMLDSAHASADVSRLWIDPYGWREYFLLENRQLSGYDAGLPAAGLLLWHIDESRTRNSDEARKWVDLEEADGLAQLDANTNRGDTGDPFPGSSANTIFNDGSNPDSKAYGGAATNISVLNISASSATMMADLTPRAGSMGDHISYSQRRPRISSGFGVGATTAYAGLRVLNSTAQDEFQGVDVYITDSTSATVDVLYYSSMTGGAPTILLHSETGFAASPGWNRLLLATPQAFPAAATRGVVLKIVNNSSTSVLSQDNSRMGSGRSYVDADGLGTFNQICTGPGEPCGDLNIVTLLGSSVDNDPPTVSSITPSTLGPTNADMVSFTVEFSEAVVNFNNSSDVIVNHSGTAHSSIDVSGSGSSYTVEVMGITADGSFTIELDPGSDVEDIAGNALQASLASSAVVIDNMPPMVSIGPPSSNNTSSGPVSYEITYSGASSVSLAAGNVAFNQTGTANGTVGVSGAGTSTRTVTISGISGAGTLGISIAAGTASDTAGNNAGSAGPSAVFNVVESETIFSNGFESPP